MAESNNVMQLWYDAAKKRSSVRTFSDSVSKETYNELKLSAADLCTDNARIEVRAKNGVLGRMPIVSSLLGGVEGTNCFAAVIVKNGNNYMGGYIGEAFVLDCVSKGLSTCWLGASYKKGAVKQYIELAENEKIIAIIAIGKADELPQPAVKKSTEQLTGLVREDFLQIPAWQQEAVRIAKLAPSARNKQPWELDIHDDYIRLLNNSSNFGFGDVDCGIAMLHIELGAAKYGVYGEWKFNNGETTFVPYGNEPKERVIIDDSVIG